MGGAPGRPALGPSMKAQPNRQDEMQHDGYIGGYFQVSHRHPVSDDAGARSGLRGTDLDRGKSISGRPVVAPGVLGSAPTQRSEALPSQEAGCPMLG
jgi:hypothetical protein